MITDGNFPTMLEQVQSYTDSDLLVIWRSLCATRYSPDEYYDLGRGIKMDDWANAIYSEICARNIQKTEDRNSSL
jgi:hypothetical protein